MYVHVPVWMQAVCLQNLQNLEERGEFSASWIIAGCRAPDVGARNWTSVLWKSIEFSELPSHLSSLLLNTLNK